MISVDTRAVFLSAAQQEGETAKAGDGLRFASVLLRAALPKEAPREWLLLPYGVINTTYGPLIFEREDAADVIAAYSARGVDLRLDDNHESEPDSPSYNSSSVSRGWFGLEAREDGLWMVAPRFMGGATGIVWTAEGKRRVESLEVRYFSPSLRVNGQQRIKAVTSAALTNDPATLNQRPILMSAGQGVAMEWAQIEAALKAAGKSDTEIAAARARYEGNTSGAVVNLSAAQADASAAKEAQRKAEEALAKANAELDKQKREALFLSYAGRYTDAERPVLESLPLDKLEALLKAKPEPSGLDTVRLSAPGPKPASVSGGAARGWKNRPWNHLNYRERSILFREDKALYLSLREGARAAGLPVYSVDKEHLGRPVFLATGTTTRPDVVEVVPQVLNDAIQAGFAGMSVLSGSPAVVIKGDLPYHGGRKGGNVITMPYFESIGAFETVAEGAAVAAPQKLETTQETATIGHKACQVDLTYAAQAFAAEGSDIYMETARQLIEQGRLAMEDALITAALTTTLSEDVSAVGDGKVTYDAFLDALALWGDEEESGARAMMFGHSASLRQIRAVRDAMGLPIFHEAREGGMPRVLGIPWRSSDRVGLDTAKRQIVIVKPGALALWYSAERFRVQSFHDVTTDQDLNTVHLYFAAHLYKRPPRLTKIAAVKLLHAQ